MMRAFIRWQAAGPRDRVGGGWVPFGARGVGAAEDPARRVRNCEWCGDRGPGRAPAQSRRRGRATI